LKRALLALESGDVFHGLAVGALGSVVGEVVFNTSMTGYQEILTDPSYAQQIVTLTYPHIGNTGINPEDVESTRPWAVGLVIRDLPKLYSNWRATGSLSDYLKEHNILAIAELDTRALTRLIREKGALKGCITTDLDEKAAIEQARQFPGLLGADLAQVVTTTEPYVWTEGTWQVKGNDAGVSLVDSKKQHIVAIDFGIKQNILRLLADRGCKITVVPAKTSAKEIIALKPDGVFLSNGPGDPAACDYAIETIRELLETNTPLFGICLGHQLLALACGAKTVKMKFGHHGANHPVKDLATGTVMISSQNHGFVVDESTLPDTLTVTHRSLFDGTVQGLAHKEKPAFTFQGHPEGSPGPHDVVQLFDQFMKRCQALDLFKLDSPVKPENDGEGRSKDAEKK